MNHVLVTLIVLASSGAAASAQDQGALQRDRPCCSSLGSPQARRTHLPTD
jgi:hypothetical protein